MDKSAIPMSAPQVPRLGMASVQGLSMRSAAGISISVEDDIWPVAVISGGTPMALKRRPNMPAKE
ncbi:hypothetical protein D3C72_2392670 [compost metagenome]